MIRSRPIQNEYAEGYRDGVTECALVVLNAVADAKAYLHLLDEEARIHVEAALGDVIDFMRHHEFKDL